MEQTEELRLSRGVPFILDGVTYMVFAFVWTIKGDIPARKGIAGYNVSSSCEYPCHICKDSHNQFKETIVNQDSVLRDGVLLNILKGGADSNTGKIQAHSVCIADTIGIPGIIYSLQG